MALFQKSVLANHLNSITEKEILSGWEKFQNYKSISENIRTYKEEEFQYKFLEMLFVDCLGYKISDVGDEKRNLFTEVKNVSDSKKADGAIKKDDEVIAVIELKSTKTKDFKKIQEQAFGYKVNQPKCKYVITSNFEKLRFYINDATEFEEFDLFNLTQHDFKLLHVCLHINNIFNGIPEKLKTDSVFEEENITKKLYKDYSAFRKEVFNSLVENNTEYDKLLLFNKTQKLLDRFLFIFFAEDRNLVPANSISKIITKWESDIAFGDSRSLYSIFIQYFHVLNIGRPAKGEYESIFAYNGGLFAEDEVLNSIKIDDEILLRHTKNLSHYDFESDVSVNILGHIFEHSLSEIEEIQKEISGLETGTSKRKKDGVFYTPQYITKYIVENSLGKLCNEKKIELDINEETYAPSSKRSRERIQALENYRNWLLGLTICDPACGSGAFLNQALSYLIEEHKYVDELSAKYNKDSLVLSDVKSSILENNLFGVDINEESVEIAKLSLWLRTAEKGRKLTSLSDNIKCGNSLIDNAEIAGDKAFNWKHEFPKVFVNGGFDVVIGNPPYVKVQHLQHEEIDWYKKHKQVAHKRVDISIMFFELASVILKKEGLLAFITSNQFLTAEYGRKCRVMLLSKFKIEKIIDYGDLPIFQDALTYVSIFNLRKSKPEDFNLFKVKNITDAISSQYSNPIEIKINNLNEDSWVLQDSKIEKIITKLKNQQLLSDFGNCNYGIVSGNDSVFILDDAKIFKYSIEKEILLPLIRANNCGRYEDVKYDLFIFYPYKLENGKTIFIEEEELKSSYPNAYSYIVEYKDELLSRRDSRKTFEGRTDWYTLTRFGRLEMFNNKKIVYPGETKHNKFGIDNNRAGYSGARVFSITLNENCKINITSLLGVLNSKLIEFYLHSTAPVKAGGYFSYSSNILNQIPIPKELPSRLLVLVEDIIECTSRNEKTVSSFQKYLLTQFQLDKLTRSLQSWHELEFGDFIKELNKAIKKVGGEKLTKMDEMDWMEVFETKKAEAQALKAEIIKTDKEIDQMVYELYGLTQKEIEIVENS